jgi:pimeloyl-ACP methyl ester carboxylesterase
MLLLLQVLHGCGGGGEDEGQATSTTPPTDTTPNSADVTISGIVAKGIVSGGRVRATEIIAGLATGRVSEVELAADGRFTVSMPRGLTLLQLVPTLGTTTQDEATGALVQLPATFVFRSIVDTGLTTSTTARAHITPFTEIMTSLAIGQGALTPENVKLARSGVTAMIGADPVETRPVQIDRIDAAGSTPQERRISILNAAVSRMAATDALACGLEPDYSAQISCTVGEFGSSVSIADATGASGTMRAQATTANMTHTQNVNVWLSGLKVLSVGYTAYSAINEAVDGVQQVASNSWQWAKDTTVNIKEVTEFIYTDAAAEARAKLFIDGSAYDQTVANRVYVYAHLSDLVYALPEDYITPSAINNTLRYLEDRAGSKNWKDTRGAELPKGWAILDWSKTSESARPRKFSNGLAFNAFVHTQSKQIVFAFRGTEPDSLVDWSQDLAQVECLPGGAFQTQYSAALDAFLAFVANRPLEYRDFRIITTGHSLGGGLASYVAYMAPESVDLAISLNGAPLCYALHAIDGGKGSNSDNIWQVGLKGEFLDGLAWAGANLGQSDQLPSPVAAGRPDVAHSLNALLPIIDYGRWKCAENNCDAIDSFPIYRPSRSIEALLTESSLSAASVPYNGALQFTGSGLRSLAAVHWTCKAPNGASCSASQRSWYRATWESNVDELDDSAITLRPQLLSSGDAGIFGDYQWTVTLENTSGSRATESFRVTLDPPTATGPIVRDISSPDFSLGTKQVLTSDMGVAPEITLSGERLDGVTKIDFNWSGEFLPTGKVTWAKGETDWLAKVLEQRPDVLVIKPIVVEAGAAWLGSAVWTVTTHDASGQKSSMSFSVLRTSATPSGSVVAPLLVSPASNVIGLDVTPVLTWSGGSAPYWQVNIRNTLTNDLLGPETLGSTTNSYTVPTGRLQPGVRYKWNVTACPDSACSNSASYRVSADRYFTTAPMALLAAPSAIQPAIGQGGVSTAPTISWTPVAGATGYWLMVATSASDLPTDPAESSCPRCLISGSTSSTSHTLPSAFINALGRELAPGTAYYWQVQAFSTATVPMRNGEFSSIRSFTTAVEPTLLDAPSLTAPAGGATDVSTTPTFRWSAVSGANRYWLTVATASATLPANTAATSCSGCVISGNTGSTSQVAGSAFPYAGTSVALQPGTTYYWRVQAYNSDGINGDFSVTRSFTVAAVAAAPSISGVSPSSYPAVSGDRTMTISGSNFISGAKLIFDPPTGSNLNSSASKLTFVSSSRIDYEFNNAGDAGTWTVRVVNPDGQQSAVASFTVAAVASPPATPTQLTPGTTDSPGPVQPSNIVQLNWEDKSGATYYELGVTDLSSNTLVVDRQPPSSVYSVQLQSGRPYRWNVAACNAAGCSNYSALRYFRTP